MNAPVTPSARNALAGIWRLTYPQYLTVRQLLTALGLLALLFVLTSGVGRGPWQTYDRPLNSLILFVFPILAFLSGGSAVREVMQPLAVDYILTRPLRRPLLLLFKFLCHLACIQVAFLPALAVIAFVASNRQAPDIAGALPWLLLAQVLALTCFTAFGFLCGAITSRFFIPGLIYGGIVEIGLANVETEISRFSMLQQVRSLVHPRLPGSLPDTSGPGMIATMGILLLAVAAMLAVASFLFSARELAGEKAKDS